MMRACGRSFRQRENSPTPHTLRVIVLAVAVHRFRGAERLSALRTVLATHHLQLDLVIGVTQFDGIPAFIPFVGRRLALTCSGLDRLLIFSSLSDVSQHRGAAIGEGQYQRFGPVRRLDAALAHFVFGLDFDQAAGIDFIADRSQLRGCELISQPGNLALLESLAQGPIQFSLEVTEAAREPSGLAHVYAIDIAKAQMLKVVGEIRAHPGAVEVDFFETVLELIEKGDNRSTRVATPGLHSDYATARGANHAHGLVIAC